MKILHLCWEYPPLVYGGLGRHVDALSRAQARAGHEVTVVTQAVAGAPSEELRECVRVLRAEPDGGFPDDLRRMLSWVTSLEARLRALAASVTTGQGVDVVHAHDWMVARAAATVTSDRRAAYVATVHATEAGRHQGWLPGTISQEVHIIEQWLADEADQIIVCSHAMAAEVTAAHKVAEQRVTVIPNGIDLAQYQRPAMIPDELLPGEPRILFVGRIEWEKGVFTALDAFAAIAADLPHARLRIVGTGTQVEAVNHAIERANLVDRIEVLGHVDHERLLQVYASSDLILAPSSYEPFGLVALEAAALGVPLIAGRTGGLAEFVEPGRTGSLVPPADPAALADAIRGVLADPRAAALMATAAGAKLSAYDWSQVAARTQEVYARAGRVCRPPRRRIVPAGPLW